MRRLLLSLLFVFAAALPGTAAIATQANDCAAIEAYLETVDAAVIEQTMTLIEDPEWISGAEALTAHLVATDGDVEGLTVEQFEPMIQLWSVPMHVLGEIPAEEIPAAVQPLHDSSLDQWTLMPALLEAIGTSGPLAAFAFMEELDQVTNRNWAAQESVRAGCGDLVAGYDARRERLTTMFQVMDSGDFTPIIEANAEDLDGLGVTYLFFAAEEDVTATPAS